MTPGRFDYVQYDEKSNTVQAAFKALVVTLEQSIEEHIQCPRSKATALTNLEVVYMWIGKGVRNDQVARTKTNTLQEQRTNS